MLQRVPLAAERQDIRLQGYVLTMHLRSFGASALLVVFAGCAVYQGAVFEIDGPRRILVVERRPAHTFLAEYHRALVLLVDGPERARAPMAMDSGGYSRANLYRLQDGRLLVTDYDASYSVDTAAWSLNRAATRRVEGEFLGSFDEDDSGDWLFIRAEWRRELPTDSASGDQQTRR